MIHARPIVWIWLLLSIVNVDGQSNATKRGLAYHNPADRNDDTLFLSTSSPMTWYYNWSPYGSGGSISRGKLEFTPLIHGISNLASDIAALSDLPSNSRHLLTFNEPDGSVSSGGSAISPADAAAAYIKSIVPLRSRFLVSHPSVTGTGSGLNWLRAFNESCYQLSETGCPADFIAAHFYGDFPALASWLGQLHAFYTSDSSFSASPQDLKIWITEMALPQQSAASTLVMMNTTLPYLDTLDYVAKYAWFGLFRSSDANEWTGNGVALLDGNGALTPLGALYLGGEQRGFTVGQVGAAVGRRRVKMSVLIGLVMVVLNLRDWL